LVASFYVRVVKPFVSTHELATAHVIGQREDGLDEFRTNATPDGTRRDLRDGLNVGLLYA
jgi:hypothetical protein